MQLEDKANSSPDSLLNQSVNSPLVEPNLNSHSAQKNTEVVPEFVGDAPPKKRRTFPWMVVAIVGILGIGGVMISLPALVSCGGTKGKQAEAKQNIGSMNRGQQAYFLEKNALANSFATLGIGINTQTVNYNYSIRATNASTLHYGISRKQDIKSYVGGVFVVPIGTANKSEMTTIGVLCEALRSGSATPTAPTLVKDIPTCGAGTKKLQVR